MSIEVAFMVWLIGIAVVCQVVEWRQKRRDTRIDSLRDELGIVSKFHDKPIPFNKGK
tara:strand:+ start:63 stop:233 length:171 start_codon:yes stop_codon:yes gene_type:complete